MKKLKPHPAANLFPMMSDSEYAVHRDDIAQHGLRDSIVLYEGQILDGRNRYKACLELGIEPDTITLDDYSVGGDPIGYVLSVNRARRHLAPSQLAMIGVEVTKLYESAAAQRMKSGKKPDPVANLRQGRASEQAAQNLGVSARSINSAQRVAREGAPEVVAAVKDGALSVSAAAELVAAVSDPQEQAEIVAEAAQQERPAQAVRGKISGGTTFNVEELEDSPPARKPRSGAPVVSTKVRKECLSLYGKFCRALKAVGVYEEFLVPLSQISDRLKQL